MKNPLLKKKLNLLIHQKYSFLYLERCIIKLENKCVIAQNKDEKKNIPVETIFSLLIENGVSITNQAIERISLAGCQLNFLNAKIRVHTVWNSGFWFNPLTNIEQVNKASNPEIRFKIAKTLTIYRFIKSENYESVSKIVKSESINQLMGYESVVFKAIYRKFSKDFRRNNTSSDLTNMKMNILNNAFYYYVNSLILSYGFNPSIGFIHGYTRKGALVFDIADIFKQNLCLDIIFNEDDMKKSLNKLSDRIYTDNNLITRQIFELLKLIFIYPNIENIDLELLFKDSKNVNYNIELFKKNCF